MGGSVKAEATVMMSLKKSNSKEDAGNDFVETAPKCSIYALSFSIPQVVFTQNVMRRFCMGIDNPGIILE